MHVNTIYLLIIVCTSIATYVILGRLECIWKHTCIKRSLERTITWTYSCSNQTLGVPISLVISPYLGPIPVHAPQTLKVGQGQKYFICHNVKGSRCIFMDPNKEACSGPWLNWCARAWRIWRPCLGPLPTRAKSRDHEIVRAQKKMSKGRRPNTPPKLCSVVTDPQA